MVFGCWSLNRLQGSIQDLWPYLDQWIAICEGIVILTCNHRKFVAFTLCRLRLDGSSLAKLAPLWGCKGQRPFLLLVQGDKFVLFRRTRPTVLSRLILTLQSCFGIVPKTNERGNMKKQLLFLAEEHDFSLTSFRTACFPVPARIWLLTLSHKAKAKAGAGTT